MSSVFWKEIKAKAVFGAGKVTERQKDAVIEKAALLWEKMGLTQDEMAYGLAVMNVESGFNPYIKNPDPTSTAYGLGQLNDATWRIAVDEYNSSYRALSETMIYADFHRNDALAQIKVMGAWIRKACNRGLKLKMADDLLRVDERKFNDYSFMEIAYALWHKGMNSGTSRLRNYLHGTGENDFRNAKTKVDVHFSATYTEGHDALDKWKVYSPVIRGKTEHTVDAAKPSVRSKVLRNHGATLKRDPENYHNVVRIEADGSERGSFMS